MTATLCGCLFCILQRQLWQVNRGYMDRVHFIISRHFIHDNNFHVVECPLAPDPGDATFYAGSPTVVLSCIVTLRSSKTQLRPVVLRTIAS